MFNRYNTNNSTFYNPTFYDRLFAIIALLVIICCIPHAVVGEPFTGTTAIVVSILYIIAAVATISATIYLIIDDIREYKKNQEKDLKGLNKELDKVTDRKDDRNDDLDKLNDKIEDIETKLEAKRPGLNDAWQKMIASGTTFGEKSAVVDSKQVAYDKVVSAYDTHVTYCYNVQNGYPCAVRDTLYDDMKSAESVLNGAKRVCKDAKLAYDRAIKHYKKLSKEFGKIAKKLADLEEDKADLEDDLANDQKRENELTAAIKEKEGLIEQATTDGELVESAKDKAPTYIESFNAAYESGADMEEWVKICPPPESVKKFVEEFTRIQETYGEEED